MKKMVFLVLPRKKMVFHSKTNFSHVKRWFWSGLPQENHPFTREKLGFWLQNHLFTRQKLVFVSKTIFLRGKCWFCYGKPSFYEAKPKKPSFSKSPPHSLKKMVFLFFWFCLVKDGFGAQNQLLPRKKMVFLRQSRPKPSFYVGKVGFAMENHLLTRQNQKKHLFNIPSPFSKKDCFFFCFLVLPRKRWFWSQKPTFTSQKDGFPEAVQTKTIFLRGKSWFSYEKPSFYEAKPKNHLFQNPLPIL